MNSCTHVIQVTNVSPSTTSEQMRTLFGFLGNIEELKLFPPDDSPLPVTSRVCFVKFLESESVGVSQHLTNTVFVDRALIVVPFAEGVIPDESKAMSLLAPANAVAGMMPGAGLLPTPNPLASMGGTPFGAPNLEQIAAMGIAGPNMNPQALSADFLKLMQSMDTKLSPLAAGLNINPGLKNDGSNKEIEEAMKRVREAQSLISAAIEPGSKKDNKRKHSRSRSRSRRRRSRSRSRHRRSHSRSRRRSHSRTRRKSKSPRRRKSHSRDRSRRSRSRDRKEEKSKKRSKTPPKSYSSARRSRSVNRRHRRSRSGSRSSKKRLTRSPSLRRHKKEKKKDKDREKERERERREHRDQGREQRERSSSKKKSKDKERDHDRKSDSDKGDVKVMRDYDEEEQGYSSEKDMEEDEERKSDSDYASSPKGLNVMERSQCHAPKKSKLNGDDHHQEDMEMSD
ncbi:serine/arginine-rich splicing factor 11-like isoform X2 [Syngnathus typhle]|uniref:serine/arginine-rich splicing factor 11-like isoform X2 n=1 Tax=Syngnathus typhle TaxID=161592 RepID=UPI002A6ADEC6|nr:serine/arginine-rich splicing factor 11-like isoform X2 [Syngnathus typhle]